MNNKMLAKSLEAQGYAITSRAHCMAARIDREDWKTHLAALHAPWSPLGEGVYWVEMLGDIRAADHYRRCVSKDKVTVREEVRRYMPKSSDCEFGYRSKTFDHQTFISSLWAKEIDKEFKLYEKNKHLWEDITMEKTIKCFHLNDSNFFLPGKVGDFYPEETRRYWGHVVTNKAKRTDRDFALLFDPKGRKINNITHATFKRLSNLMKHIYIKNVSIEELNDFLNLIPSLSKLQILKLLVHIQTHPNIKEVESLKYINRNTYSFIMVEDYDLL